MRAGRRRQRSDLSVRNGNQRLQRAHQHARRRLLAALIVVTTALAALLWFGGIGGRLVVAGLHHSALIVRMACSTA